MLANPAAFAYHLHRFYEEKVVERKRIVASRVDEIARVVFDVLKEVEIQEPRFISQLNEVNGRYEGISVVSPTEYEVSLPCATLRTELYVYILIESEVWMWGFSWKTFFRRVKDTNMYFESFLKFDSAHFGILINIC